jgi:predicted DNA-binding transcriptional regulator YafY
MTAQELADELEVSVRTVYRDVDSLSASGVPVYSDRGPTGGYRLIEGYRTRLTGLTPDEADSIFLAGVPGPAAELGLGTVLAAAQLKLMAALPPELRSRAGRIRERFHLDAPAWFHESESPAFLAETADAVWNQRSIHVRYQRWDGQVTRTLDPLGIVLKSGTWYLVARSDDQLRTYRASRILEFQLLDDTFERPDDFDLVAYWQTWSDEFEAKMLGEQAIVRLSPWAQELLPNLFSPLATKTAMERASGPDERGWIETAIPFNSIREGQVRLMRFGPDAEVLAPPELRNLMIEGAAAMTALYHQTSESQNS